MRLNDHTLSKNFGLHKAIFCSYHEAEFAELKTMERLKDFLTITLFRLCSSLSGLVLERVADGVFLSKELSTAHILKMNLRR